MKKADKFMIAILSAALIALVLGIVLMQIAVIPATVVITVSVIAFAYGLSLLCKRVVLPWMKLMLPKLKKKFFGRRRQRKFHINKTKLMRNVITVTFVVVVIFVIILLIRGCGSGSGGVTTSKAPATSKVPATTTTSKAPATSRVPATTTTSKAPATSKVPATTTTSKAPATSEVPTTTTTSKAPATSKVPATTTEPDIDKHPTVDTHTCVVARIVTEEPSCIKAGSVAQYCSCGRLLARDTLPATGHTYGNGSITKEPTETSEGTMTYKCRACGHTKTEAVSKLAHVCKASGTVTVAATCSAPGYIRSICSCGKVLSEVATPSTDHDYTSVVVKEPTGSKPGRKVNTCKSCGDSYESEIPATGAVEDPVEENFFIKINGEDIDRFKVVGEVFNEIVITTSADANEIIVLQTQPVFTVTVKDSHTIVLTVGGVETYGKVRIYHLGHLDYGVKVVDRLSPIDPNA